MSKPSIEKVYWRSLEALAGSEQEASSLHDEFPKGDFEEYLRTRDASDVSRRGFLGLMGASVAAADSAVGPDSAVAAVGSSPPASSSEPPQAARPSMSIDTTTR